MDWHLHFDYDPTSPEAIRWKDPKGIRGTMRGTASVVAGAVAGRPLTKGKYPSRYVTLNGVRYPVRAVVVEMWTGVKIPVGRKVVVNGDKADHRIGNLRLGKFDQRYHKAEHQGVWPVDGSLPRTDHFVAMEKKYSS